MENLVSSYSSYCANHYTASLTMDGLILEFRNILVQQPLPKNGEVPVIEEFKIPDNEAEKFTPLASVFIPIAQISKFKDLIANLPNVQISHNLSSPEKIVQKNGEATTEDGK